MMTRFKGMEQKIKEDIHFTEPMNDQGRIMSIEQKTDIGYYIIDNGALHLFYYSLLMMEYTGNFIAQWAVKCFLKDYCVTITSYKWELTNKK